MLNFFFWCKNATNAALNDTHQLQDIYVSTVPELTSKNQSSFLNTISQQKIKGRSCPLTLNLILPVNLCQSAK